MKYHWWWRIIKSFERKIRCVKWKDYCLQAKFKKQQICVPIKPCGFAWGLQNIGKDLFWNGRNTINLIMANANINSFIKI